LVQDGIVLGQTKILSDDTRTLLRQVIAAQDRHGLLSAWDAAFTRFGTLILAILALVGLSSVAPAAAIFIHNVFNVTRTREEGGSNGRRGEGGSSAKAAFEPTARESSLRVAAVILEDITGELVPTPGDLQRAIDRARTSGLRDDWRVRDWSDLDNVLDEVWWRGELELYEALHAVQEAQRLAKTTRTWITKTEQDHLRVIERARTIDREMLDAVERVVQVARNNGSSPERPRSWLRRWPRWN